MKKYVYLFNEGNKDMRDLLGGKGANLAEMCNMGLPVPLGFTVTTEACKQYYSDGETLSENVKTEILIDIKKLKSEVNKKIGDTENPLLLSVRSGAPVSMPGMMDTILNLGLNDKIAKSLSKDEDSIRFIYDSYRRLIMMFADVVKGKDKDKFEEIMEKYKTNRNAKTDLELTAEDMYNIAMESKDVYKEIVGEDFPEEPRTQLLEAIGAVFKSWNNKRAKVYREINNISNDLGTAVNVQMMVYGNLSEDSLTGVAFSRNPSTGEDELYGEFLEKAQGEDIVAGVRTPKPVEVLERNAPHIYKELKDISKLLEYHYKDMQDMEFTVEKGKLYMLQTRNGKRTSQANLNIAVDMAKSGLITKEDALLRVTTSDLDNLMHKTFEEKALKEEKPIAKGLPASPGAVSGKIYFTEADILKNYKDNNVILVREETSPEDIESMKYAVGLLTVRGGMTSHAAVVARGLGRCCVSGCSDITVNADKKTLTVGSITLTEGDYISLDGSTGNVYEGVLPTTDPVISGNFETLLNWAKEIKKLGVRANADTAKDATVAFNFGAEGIGLCRTEHMFFEEHKIFAIRKMILAETEEEKQKALDELLPIQTNDFEELFRAANGKILTIRYLDPPLHEFLPKKEEDIKHLASSLNVTIKSLKEKIESLKQFNPMMGLRGCRLDITYPGLAVMQTKAVLTAAKTVKNEGIEVKPEIMLPLIGDPKELKDLKDIIEKTATEIIPNGEIKYKIGTMIEVPRSTILSSEIAKEADFFSFGTNDLTQMTFGFSRDDSASFLPDYYKKGILDFDPFKTIDKNGVGKLIEVTKILSKKSNPNIELGVCGEHGGDEESIKFFNKLGLDYVSCSPYRVPIAILSAAKAELQK